MNRDAVKADILDVHFRIPVDQDAVFPITVNVLKADILDMSYGGIGIAL